MVVVVMVVVVAGDGEGGIKTPDQDSSKTRKSRPSWQEMRPGCRYEQLH